ncbi:hypothetical protein Hamer_G015073, partial [Homarus americanus]
MTTTHHQPTLIMLSLLNISLDGELAKKHGENNESPGTSDTPSYPSPAATSHAPRLKRPTFLPIKNHARPALSSNDKRSPIGAGKGLEERSHESLLPLVINRAQKAPYCSPLSSLTNSMYQLPAVTIPTALPSVGGTSAGVVGVGVAAGTPVVISSATPTTTANLPVITASSGSDALVSRRSKTVYGEYSTAPSLHVYVEASLQEATRQNIDASLYYHDV